MASRTATVPAMHINEHYVLYVSLLDSIRSCLTFISFLSFAKTFLKSWFHVHSSKHNEVSFSMKDIDFSTPIPSSLMVLNSYARLLQSYIFTKYKELISLIMLALHPKYDDLHQNFDGRKGTMSSFRYKEGSEATTRANHVSKWKYATLQCSCCELNSWIELGITFKNNGRSPSNLWMLLLLRGTRITCSTFSRLSAGPIK